MRKSIIILTIGIISSVLLIYLFCRYYKNIGQGYKIDWEMPNKYLWIFKDSVLGDINKDVNPVSCVKETDILTLFTYKNDYDISIWEFKDLKIDELKKIDLKLKPDLYNFKFESGVILNQDADLEFLVKNLASFSNSLEISIDNNSEILNEIESTNYRGFYGNFSKLAMGDKKNGYQIIIQFSFEKTPAILLIYKLQSSLFIVIINSVKEVTLDESIINILNLNGKK